MPQLRLLDSARDNLVEIAGDIAALAVSPSCDLPLWVGLVDRVEGSLLAHQGIDKRGRIDRREQEPDL